jgi:hypothetical protein
MEWSEVKSQQLKLVAAGVGASAVVAMGAIGLAFSDVSAAEPPDPGPPGPVMPPDATTGETSTEAAAPDAPDSPTAVPDITTPPSTIPTGEPQ